ncbi:MAG: hypothetical protein K2P58_07080 [Hyphomonadaceae bacterium]|nr:hypothetical protein [Hyphomonadaceae bacterium]
MRLLILIAAFALASCSPQGTEDAQSPTTEAPVAAHGQLEEFQLPSSNIGCAYIPAGGTAVYRSPDGRAELQCDRVAPTYVRIIMSETGPARVQTDVSDAPCCAGETVAYGQSWSRGPFTCQSAEAGLTCSNSDGHALFLSRDRAESR